MLYHVSDTPGIAIFQPRTPPAKHVDLTAPCVWAVDAAHLANYLLPRDCARVCFRAVGDVADSVKAELLGPNLPEHVIAIEAGWLATAVASPIWLYHFPQESFTCIDEAAGYFISKQAVTPLACEQIDAPLLACSARGVELRIVDSLWPLRDRVLASGLEFSFIRMGNALGREAAGG